MDAMRLYACIYVHFSVSSWITHNKEKTTITTENETKTKMKTKIKRKNDFLSLPSECMFSRNHECLYVKKKYTLVDKWSVEMNIVF